VVEIAPMSHLAVSIKDKHRKEECSFLKKRTKKLVFYKREAEAARDSVTRVFCFFFQKRSACLSSNA